MKKIMKNKNKTEKDILIKTKSKNYFVKFPKKIESEIALIRKQNPSVKIAIITDSHLKKKYTTFLANVKKKYSIISYSFGSGEENKNINTKLAIESFLFKNGFDRKSILIAFGGGVVGDVVGYVAATFMRGIPFYQIPTSIVAMTDSSVGGKTGIDNEYGKNLIGAFYQPEAVLIDISLLKTLSRAEFIAGFAEVLKYAFIKSKKLFQILDENSIEEIIKKPILLEEIIRESVLIKNEVVSKDEKETTGYREILNFGHTVGHAIENLMNYKTRHGEGVAIGMAVESFFSYQCGFFSEKKLETVLSLLKKYQLPHQIPKHFTNSNLYKVMLKDKKTYHAEVSFILLKDIAKIFKKKEDERWSTILEKEDILSGLKKYRKNLA